MATVGRPVARHLDDAATAEVTRVATEGTRNANSLLYAACWRAARAMGYHRLLTYTQDDETGATPPVRRPPVSRQPPYQRRQLPKERFVQ